MNKYTEELRRILKQSEIEAMENNDPLVGTEHILLSILKIKNSLTETFYNYNITYDNIKTNIKKGNNKVEFVFYYNRKYLRQPYFKCLQNTKKIKY